MYWTMTVKYASGRYRITHVQATGTGNDEIPLEIRSLDWDGTMVHYGTGIGAF